MMIRIYQQGTIRDLEFPASGTCRIGSSPKDDIQLPALKKHAICIKNADGALSFTAAPPLENDGSKGSVSENQVYVINSERMEAFAVTNPDLEDITLADLSAQDQVTIGRKEDCPIQIHDRQISKHHARLFRAQGEWHIEDLKSANGLYVNGRAESAAVLRDGDTADLAFCQLKLSGDTLSIRCPARVTLNLVEPQALRPCTSPENYPYAFRRSPRLKKEIHAEVIEIQTAPMIGAPPHISWMSVLVTPLISVAIMAAMIFFAGFSPMSLMFSAPMTVLGIFGAVFSYRKQVKAHRSMENLRLSKYDEYLTGITARIKKAHQEQRSILTECHPSVNTCMQMAASVDRSLWGKRIEDQDFLTLRIGSGDLPSSVTLQVPREMLTLEKDILASYPAEIKEEYQRVTNCPITIDLLRSVTVGLIGQRESAVLAAKNLVVEAATHHSCDELKLVIACGEDELDQWAFARWLPHTFDDTRTRRYMGAGKDAVAMLQELTDTVVQKYRDAAESRSTAPVKPYYLFVFTDYAIARDSGLLKLIARNDPSAGVGALFLFDEISRLPKECGMIVELDKGRGTACLREKANEVKSFVLDQAEPGRYEAFARSMAPIRVELEQKNVLPTSISFLQGYGVKRIREYPLEEAWKSAEPYQSMAVPVGVRASGEPFLFDIHEKKHGPHGLVAGMTGSGKSEMVQTWILSMALRFSPEDVSFVLIDFKGTGLILPFRNLPHLAGTISDLDTSIGRNLIALENELNRRKALLDQYGVKNISEYKKLYREGRAGEPLSYLFIVIDEFAEFKVKFPEFMQVVDSVFGIGRTLGVSMILLTQKPTSVVDDKMNANTRFRWCLKVASSADSKDMIGHTDAARITNPGRAIVQVGEDEVYETIQSYYSGAPYNPYKDPALSDSEKVAVVDLQGRRTTYEAEKTTGYRSSKNEIDVVVEYLDEYVRTNNLSRARSIWVQKLPEEIHLRQLLSIAFDGEKWADTEPGLRAVIGLTDDPRSQAQYPMQIDLSRGGHLAVLGAPGTGKTTLLQTTAMSLALSYPPDRLHMYLMDFGGGHMNQLKGLPHVGGVALADDRERMEKLALMISNELKRRKQLFASCGAMSVQTCTELTGEALPYVVLLLDNFAPVYSLYPGLEDFFVKLAMEGGTYGIYWIVSANTQNMLTFKISQSIKNAVALRMAERSDYSSIVGKTDGLEPENVLGRGLVKGNPPLEFQTALPAEGEQESERIRNLKALVELMDRQWTGPRPRAIPVMPEEIAPEALDGPGVALGLTSESIERLFYDPYTNPFAVLSIGRNCTDQALTAAVCRQYACLPYERLILFNGTGGMAADCSGSQKELTGIQEFDQVICDLMPLMQKRKNEKAEKNVSYDPVILLLTNVGRCFQAMDDKTAGRINLLLTLGRSLDVMVVLSDERQELSRLYHGGAPFVVSAVNAGVGIALGDRLKDHDIFQSGLPYSQQDQPLAGDEGYLIRNGTAEKFKAINQKRR